MFCRFFIGVYLKFEPSAKTKKLLRYAFYLVIIIYMSFRVILASETLGRYGVNPYIFGLLDVGTAIPYAIGGPKVITYAKQRNKNKIFQWSIIFAISFILPYVYIAISGEKIPFYIWLVLGFIVFGLGTQAFLSLRSKIKKAMSEDNPQN